MVWTGGMFTIEPMATAPVLALAAPAMDTLLNELRAYHVIYSPLFQRRVQREWSEKYLHGWLLELPRKSIEPMVLALEGANRNTVRGMQQFLSEGAWDDDPILRRHWQEVDHDLGDDHGVLTLDGSDFPKQGTASVGVKRQYCGELDKRANGQAGVFLGYASPHGYTLLDRRLYLPQEWVEDAGDAERCKACGVPEDIACTTKAMLGWAMLQAVHHAGSLRCRGVACDETFGRATTLVDNIAGLRFWDDAEVPHDTRVGQERPATSVPAWSGRGRKPTRAQVVTNATEPQAVALTATALPASAWSQQVIKEGSKGPIVADFATLRVIAVRDGLPGTEGWLILLRNGLTGELKTYLMQF
jgi:SRSO17 transposase